MNTPNYTEITPSIPLTPAPPSSKPTASLGKTEEITPPITPIAPPVDKFVTYSFMITYILLLTTATVTFIEAMRTKNERIRHILNLETVISIIAGYFYSIFLGQIEDAKKSGTPFIWTDISKIRYVDWGITTPIMLMVLCLVLSINAGVPFTIFTYLYVVVLNYIMLILGFLGENGSIDKIVALMGGFIAFFGMFYLIYNTFIRKLKYNFDNTVIFWLVFGVWSLYGVFYMLEEEYKNIGMNILDCIAKCFVGLSLWAYYSNIFS